MCLLPHLSSARSQCMCGCAQLQLAGGGVHAKSGQWAATQEEADTIDRSIARNKAWVRSLQDKEQWLNRPRPDGTIGAALPLHMFHCCCCLGADTQGTAAKPLRMHDCRRSWRA